MARHQSLIGQRTIQHRSHSIPYKVAEDRNPREAIAHVQRAIVYPASSTEKTSLLTIFQVSYASRYAELHLHFKTFQFILFIPESSSGPVLFRG
jgi:hypothetical protein